MWSKTISGTEQVAIVLLNLAALSQQGLLNFEDFYSQSFIPDALQIEYRIENNVSIYYNITTLMPFPGKILFHIFVRRVPNASGEPSENVLRYKNLDFCKTLDMVKNFTADHYQSESWLQSTFITSCPLMRGFYYISNGTIEDELVPIYFGTGKYWLQFELIQIFDEVTKLFNVKAKWYYESHW